VARACVCNHRGLLRRGYASAPTHRLHHRRADDRSDPWCGNSFPHLFGYRNYETNDNNSCNNALVAIITSDERWYNNHHADPNSASNQRHWWEIDLTYLPLRLLVLLGLAWDVQLPKRTETAV
jgi:fatty-acid desaturase